MEQVSFPTCFFFFRRGRGEHEIGIAIGAYASCASLRTAAVGAAIPVTTLVLRVVVA